MPEYDPNRSYVQRRYWLQAKYDITEDEYIRLYNAQDGRCAICGIHPADKLLCVDHDHKTGLVRGLLCVRCNTGIGYFLDNIGSLIAAAIYLERFEMARETATHKKYMEQYNKEKHREELSSTGQLAPEPIGSSTNWEEFYSGLYNRLELNNYLPKVLGELRERESSRSENSID
jgi:recombination endonuclease VII